MLKGTDLRRYRIFMQLTDAELDEIAPLAKEEAHEAGERIVTEEEPATHLYLVQKGKLEVKMTGASGQETKIDDVGPGGSAGWSSLAERRISTASVDVVEPSELIAFDAEVLRRLLEDSCRIGYGVMRGLNMVVSRRLDRCRTRIAARR